MKKAMPLVAILVGIFIISISVGLLLSSSKDDTSDVSSTESSNTNTSQSKTVKAEETMTLTAEGVTPSELKIKKDTKVIFKNETDDQWQPHDNGNLYQSEVLEKGDTYEYVFSAAGEHSFHSHVGGPGGVITVK